MGAMGRDAWLPMWLRRGARPPEQPHFDSVVIRGNGITALVCAARLARSRRLAGRIVMAAPRPTASRRLINGCTLRARSLDYYAAGLGSTRETLLEALFGPETPRAETHRQLFSLCRRNGAGRFELERTQAWMAPRNSAAPVLAYGLRNSHLVQTLADQLDPETVHWHGAMPDYFEACRTLSPGSFPLVINASHERLAGVASPPRPSHLVVASQIPLRRGPRSPLPPHASFVGGQRREGGLDIGVHYPFVDPLTPAADYYGIFYRVVPLDRKWRRDEEIDAVRDIGLGVADALDLAPVDPEQTRGEAMVPGFPTRDVAPSRPDYLDLYSIANAGTPIIVGDGMTRAGLAGWVAAEAILASADVSAVTNQSLRRWRRANRHFALTMTSLSALAEPLLRRAPGPAVRFLVDVPDMWAAVA